VSDYRPRRDIPIHEQLETDPSAWLDVCAGVHPMPLELVRTDPPRPVAVPVSDERTGAA